jgi:hypothetical protein
MSLFGALPGCAGKGDIDRTQPDKVEKAIFFDASGAPKTFYYRKTTIGVPPTSAYAFEGAMGEMMKVRFDIKEKYLVGYRAYDYAIGSEGDFGSGTNNKDAPLLVFAISSHFDVKRDYNPATGEQTNVVTENDKDRPWNERAFMRVDWSHNLAEDSPDRTAADPTSQYVGAQTLETGFSVGEGDDALVNPNRPIITSSYIDFTTTELRTPDYNACATMFDPVFDDAGPWGCGPSQITYRNSLLPVPASEYDPLPYPDSQPLLDDAGNPIRTVTVDDANGRTLAPCTAATLNATGGSASGADCAVASVDQFAKFGFFRTVRPTYDRRVGATEGGREYFINRWNIWKETVAKDLNGKPVMDAQGKPVRLPYANRVARTITYYLNPEFPDDPALRESAKQVVADWNQTMKETVAALQFTEQNPSKGLSVAGLPSRTATLPDVFVLKENDCNVANVVKYLSDHPDVKNNLASQVGSAKLDLDHISKSNLLSACSGLSAVTEHLADDDPKKFVWQRNGDLRYSFIWWVDRPQPAGPLGYGPSSQDPETGEIISAAAYLYGAALDTYTQFAADSVQLLNGAISSDDLLSGKTISDILQSTAQASKARQAQKMTPEARQMLQARLQARAALPNKGLTKVAPGADDRGLNAIKGTQLATLLFNDDVLPGLFPGYRPGDLSPGDPVDAALTKPWLSSKGQEDRRKRFQTFAQKGCVYLAEFADDAILGTALNLDKQKLTGDALWKALRASIFRGLTDHEMGHTLGLRHNFAASTDALNYDDQYWQIRTTMPEAQWEPKGLSELAYASVMDYGSRFNSDVHGPGKYDKAAIRFGYGQLVDLIPSAGQEALNLRDDLIIHDYSELPTLLQGMTNVDASATVVAPYSMVVSALREGYRDLATNGGALSVFPERPYKFCADEFEGNLDCKTWDRGANQREIVDNVIDMYRNYYVFNAYQRGRTTWTIDGYLTRLRERYFNRYQEAFQFLYLFGDGLTNTALGDDLFLASADALNALGDILQTPEPGVHCVTANNPDLLVIPTGSGGNACQAGPQMGIGLPDAKPYYIDFSNDYYYRVTRTGSLYEKLVALEALTNTEARFFRIDTYADANRFAINFFQIFRDDVVRLLSGVIRNDPRTYGATVLGTSYQTTPVVDLSTWGQVAPPTPDYLKAGALRVDTPVNKTIRYWALLYGLAKLGGWDSTLDFQNFLNVSVKGSNDDATVAAGTVVKEFTHPVTGLTYRAPTTGDGASENIGVSLIDELNTLVGKAGTPGTLPVRYGTLNGQPLPDWQSAKTALDAAKAGRDQSAFTRAQAIFDAIDGLVGYRVDLLADIRSFRKQLYLP